MSIPGPGTSCVSCAILTSHLYQVKQERDQVRRALVLCLEELQEARQYIDYGLKAEVAIAKAEDALRPREGTE